MLPVRLTAPLTDNGMFGVARKYDVHTGIDFYCQEDEDVYCLIGGTVVDVFPFTGEFVGSPWWNSTDAVVVESGETTIVYGELKSELRIGDKVEKGSLIGKVTSVLKKDKGINPTSMLHMELWRSERYMKNFSWAIGNSCPEGLVNPLELFSHYKSEDFWLIKTSVGYRLEDSNGDFLRFFHMAADSKSELYQLKYTYLTEKSSPDLKFKYTVNTGKVLWFDYKGKWGNFA